MSALAETEMPGGKSRETYSAAWDDGVRFSTRPKTRFLATLKPDGTLIDGNGAEIGTAFPSSSDPGSLLVCLRTDLVEAVEEITDRA